MPFVSSVGAPFIRKGTVAVVFAEGAEQVTVTVADPSITADSVIAPAIAAGAGMDTDEMELDPIEVAVGARSAGVGFDLVFTASTPDSSPQGSYLGTFIAW